MLTDGEVSKVLARIHDSPYHSTKTQTLQSQPHYPNGLLRRSKTVYQCYSQAHKYESKKDQPKLTKPTC